MSSTTVQSAAESDAAREQRVIKGRTAKRSTSRASKSAAKSTADRKPTGMDKIDPSPARKLPEPKPAVKGPTASDQRDVVFQHLMTAAGEIVAKWDAKMTGISREHAREILAQRLRYTPGQSWDKRLGERQNIASRAPAK
jgi:hypothetical protein